MNDDEVVVEVSIIDGSRYSSRRVEISRDAWEQAVDRGDLVRRNAEAVAHQVARDLGVDAVRPVVATFAADGGGVGRPQIHWTGSGGEVVPRMAQAGFIGASWATELDRPEQLLSPLPRSYADDRGDEG